MKSLVKRSMFLYIISIFTIIAIFNIISLNYFYNHSIEHYKKEQLIVQNTLINTIKTIYDFNSKNKIFIKEQYGSHKEATMSELFDIIKLNSYENMELVLGIDKKDHLLIHTYDFKNKKFKIKKIKPDSNLAIPMKEAFKTKKSGYIISYDYDGKEVLGRYAYIKELDISIVAKSTIDVIDHNFFTISALFISSSLVSFILLIGIYRYTNKPINREIDELNIINNILFNENGIAIAFCETDTGKLIKCNRSLLNLIEYEEEDIKNINLNNLIKSEITLKELSGKPTLIDLSSKSNKQIATEFISNVYIIDDEEYSIVTILDITEKIQQSKEKSKKQAILHQQSKLASLGEMIGAIAHQWRQPLNTIGVLSQEILFNIKLKDYDEENYKSLVHDINDQLQHMSKTIDDFRNFISPNEEMKEFSLKEALFSTIKLILAQLKNNHIIIVFKNNDYFHVIADIESFEDTKSNIDIDDQIYGYKNRLIQVFLVLLQNAKDALIKEDIEDKTIEVSIEINEHGYMIKIINKDTYIDEDIIPKAFEPYFTTKTDGTGIGLYLAYSIIVDDFRGCLDLRNGDDGVIATVAIPNKDYKWEE